MPMTSRQMIIYLKKNGFRVVSQNGSHVKMTTPTTRRQTIIPMHNTDLKKGLEKAILKQAAFERRLYNEKKILLSRTLS